MPGKGRKLSRKSGRPVAGGRKGSPEAEGKRLRLEIELVPGPLWRKNLRTVIPRREWERLRGEAIQAAGNRCEICGFQGQLFGHERWDYNDARFVATLRGLHMLCGLCNLVKHFGKAGALAAEGRVDERKVVSHFMTVNGVSRSVFADHRDAAFEVWAVRSGKKWTIDFGTYADLVGPGAPRRPYRGVPGLGK